MFVVFAFTLPVKVSTVVLSAFSANLLANWPPVTASVEPAPIVPSANPVILEPLTSILPLAVADVPLFTVILA